MLQQLFGWEVSLYGQKTQTGCPKHMFVSDMGWGGATHLLMEMISKIPKDNNDNAFGGFQRTVRLIRFLSLQSM
eukprot:4501937-Ditylum_brightwellii.AAC.1